MVGSRGSFTKEHFELLFNSSIALGTLVLGFLTWYETRPQDPPAEPQPKSVESAVVDPKPQPPKPVDPPPEKKLPSGDFLASKSPAEEPAGGKNIPHVNEMPLRRFHKKMPNGKSISFFRNMPLVEPNREVTRVVLGLTNRDPEGCYKGLMDAAEAENKQNTTLIIVPIFSTQAITGNQIELVWKEDWFNGKEAVNDEKISSYDILDQFIEDLAESSPFPKLSTIVLVGHSVGGMAVHRYSALGHPKMPSQRKVSLVFIALSSNSYLYVDKRRLTANGSSFQVPMGNECEDFNHYPFGLEGRVGYVKSPTVAEVKANLASRRVYYFVGSHDIDPSQLNRQCGARLQGQNRLDRATAYWKYIQLFPDWKKTRDSRSSKN